jgi:hypothetical protein
MYSGTKSCISYNDCKSEFFPCNNGVRQGDNLSPFLFAVFMNDLVSYLTNCNLKTILTYNHYKKYKILYHYTYLQLYYAYCHSCYLRVTCTKNHLSKLCPMLSQNCLFWSKVAIWAFLFPNFVYCFWLAKKYFWLHSKFLNFEISRT